MGECLRSCFLVFFQVGCSFKKLNIHIAKNINQGRGGEERGVEGEGGEEGKGGAVGR